jgi:tetratricopeptide (TPR) repeat protein
VTPNSATAHSNLGVAYAAANQLDRAVPHFETAVRLSRGQNRLAHTNLAQAYLFRHDYEQAAYHAREALRLAQLEPPDLRNTAWEEQLLAAALAQLRHQRDAAAATSTAPAN